MMFLKNFIKMNEEELAGLYVKGGKMEVSTRTFGDILGREAASLAENDVLLGVLTDLTSGDNELDFPFSNLLELEYGKSVVPFNELPEDVLSYLLNTPYDVVRMDYNQAVAAARELFQQRLEKS